MSRRVRILLAQLATLVVTPQAAWSQADYFNTDIARPSRIEDSYVIPLYSLDLHLAPLSFARVGNGGYTMLARPGFAYGLVPRAQVQLAVPIAYSSVGGSQRSGVAGMELSALYALRGETPTLPALAARLGVLLPAGSLGPANAHPSVTGIASRTFPWARLHVNAQYNFGDEETASALESPVVPASVVLSRWIAGAALDRALPLRSLLLSVSAFAEQPLNPDEDVRWVSAAGFRFQLSSSLVLDAGLSAQVTGPDRSWSVTLGLSRVTAVRAFGRGPGS